jgi:ribosomal protein L14
MNYEIKRRINIGFKGVGGAVFKRYTIPDKLTVSVENDDTGETADENKARQEVIRYEKNTYINTGCTVQFQKNSDMVVQSSQMINGLIVKQYFLQVITSDCYFNDYEKEYDCIADVGDIVEVFGKRWIVTNRTARLIEKPKSYEWFMLDMKSIL